MLRHEAQAGRRDDAERAFRAHEQMAQRVARVVLPQPAQSVPKPPVRQDHLQPEHQVARIAVAQRVVAACVGGKNAAELRAALAVYRQREGQLRSSRRIAHGLQRGACFHHHGHAGGVDVANTVHAGEDEHDLAAGRVRCRAAAKPGVAALRDHRDAVPGAECHHRGRFPCASRPHHQPRLAMEQAAPVGGVGRRVGSGQNT